MCPDVSNDELDTSRGDALARWLGASRAKDRLKFEAHLASELEATEEIERAQVATLLGNRVTGTLILTNSRIRVDGFRRTLPLCDHGAGRNRRTSWASSRLTDCVAETEGQRAAAAVALRGLRTFGAPL